MTAVHEVKLVWGNKYEYIEEEKQHEPPCTPLPSFAQN